ncbi:MAG: CoA-binding protein [Thermodesulfobacteriota bacterium]|nr:CoA-binding protein [Thermodesulfobacteriota bacterium]
MEERFKELERAFNPRTVVVIGDKMENNNYSFLRALAAFQGSVYSVNIDLKELPGIEALGIKNYPSLLDVPDPIDYVIVAVPREVTPLILQDCIEKKVGGVTLFTSGFAETKTSKGIELANKISTIAKAAGLNLIGPNCMGIFNPRIGLKNSPAQYSGDRGSVGFISQSGGHAINFSLIGYDNGIKISKLVSYGNGYILDSSDYCEYLIQDQETDIIALYIEGIKDGRRFFNLLNNANNEKPILIWKGGQTLEGSRATSSHSGSLSESNFIWETVIKQCGAIKIDSLEEMIDTVMMLLYTPFVKKNRVGLISLSGGQCVNMTDVFSKRGLTAHLLTDQSYKKLSSILALVGASYRNPIDLGGNLSLAEKTRRSLLGRDDIPSRERLLDITLEILDNDPNIDSVVIEMSADLMRWFQLSFPGFDEYFYNTLSYFKKHSRKPIIVITPPSRVDTDSIEMKKNLLKRDIANFPSFSRGADALKKVVEYYQRRF